MKKTVIAFLAFLWPLTTFAATGTILLPIEGATFGTNSPPAFSSTNSVHRLLFDDSADEIIRWQFRLPANYSSAPVLKCIYSMASATTLEVIIGASIWAVSDGDAADLDTESYDTVNTSAATTVPGTAGYPDEISLTLTNADSMAAGDLVRLRFRRDADNAGDDASGDMELRSCSLEYTTT